MAWAAITKYHRLGGLNNRNLFLTVLDVVVSKIKVPVDLVSDESPFPGLQAVAFTQCPHMAKRARKFWSLFLFSLGH